jgi:hypothetical protein
VCGFGTELAPFHPARKIAEQLARFSQTIKEMGPVIGARSPVPLILQ